MSFSLQTIETDLVDIWEDVEAFFARLSSEEQALVNTAEQFVEKFQSYLSNPAIVTIADLIPDGVGTEVLTIANTVLADILAALTYLQGLSTTTGAPAPAVIAGDAPGALSNPDAVAKNALTLVSNATPVQQTAFLNSYGNLVMSKIAPPGTNLTIDKINLTRALKKTVKTAA